MTARSALSLLMALLRALAAILLLLARTLVLVTHLSAARTLALVATSLALVGTLLAAALAALRLLLLSLTLALLALLGLPRLLLLSHHCLHDAANCRKVLVASHMPGQRDHCWRDSGRAAAMLSLRIYKALSRFTQPHAGCAADAARSAGRSSGTGGYGDCG